MRFADISLDLHILDKFLQLTDQELIIDNNCSYNIYNTHWHDTRYDSTYIGLYDIVELTHQHAYMYFTEEYRIEDDDDYIRQAVYLNSLALVRIWLKDNKICP